jgi:hypothetical protein
MLGKFVGVLEQAAQETGRSPAQLLAALEEDS